MSFRTLLGADGQERPGTIYGKVMQQPGDSEQPGKDRFRLGVHDLEAAGFERRS